MTSYHVILCPISPDRTRKSFQDYNEQMERGEVGKQLMWDDAKSNPTKKDGYFIFLHQPGKKQPDPRAEIHKILSVKPLSYRLESWTKRPRNVLYLSEKIYTMTLSEWEEVDIGSGLERCARRIATPEKSSKFVKYVEEKIAEKMNAAANSAKMAALIAKMALNSVSDSGWEPGKKPFWLKYSDYVRKVDSSDFQKEIDQLLSDDDDNYDDDGLDDDSDCGDDSFY